VNHVGNPFVIVWRPQPVEREVVEPLVVTTVVKKWDLVSYRSRQQVTHYRPPSPFSIPPHETPQLVSVPAPAGQAKRSHPGNVRHVPDVTGGSDDSTRNLPETDILDLRLAAPRLGSQTSLMSG